MDVKLTSKVCSLLERKATPQALQWARNYIDKQRPGWSQKATYGTLRSMLAVAVKKGDLSETELASLQGVKLKKGSPKMATKNKPAVKTKRAGGSLIAGAAGGAAAGERIEVKGSFERFSAKREPITHTKHGMPYSHAGEESFRTYEKDSVRDRAQMGAWLKFTALKSGVPVNWNESDERMINEIFATQQFTRVKSRNDEELLSGAQVKAMLAQRSVTMRPFVSKALLDDSSSGGIEATPIFFDDRLVTYPVLFGEVSPYVDIRDIPRGRRVEGAGMANPAVIFGVAEGTAINPFNTSQFITALDTTIYNATCAVEVGEDFISDAGVDIASYLVEQIGMKFAQALDDTVSVGDGLTQALGILNDTISNAVNSDSGTGGPPTVSDLEDLYFSVGKQYRVAQWNPRLLMNDTSYRKYRAIPVGPTDERRVLGMSGEFGGAASGGGLAGYQLYGLPVSINQLIPNNQVVFGAMKKYRMYRRLGVDIQWYQEGNYLALRNLRLLVVRMRIGGRIIDPNAFGLMSDNSAI